MKKNFLAVMLATLVSWICWRLTARKRAALAKEVAEAKARRAHAERRVAPPAPDERWGFDTPSVEMAGTPWEHERQRPPVIVTVRDVKGGFVRYYHGDRKNSTDAACSIEDFMRTFKRWPQ